MTTFAVPTVILVTVPEPRRGRLGRELSHSEYARESVIANMPPGTAYVGEAREVDPFRDPTFDTDLHVHYPTEGH